MRRRSALVMLLSVSLTASIACIEPAGAQGLETGWFTRIFVRACSPGTVEDPRPVCSGDNPTIADVGDFDLGATGAALSVLGSASGTSQSAVSAGFAGPGFAPAISPYSLSATGQRIVTSGFGFQRYEFVESGLLEGTVTFTYSQTGRAAQQSSREPRGLLLSGVTTFQTESDVIEPLNCPRFVNSSQDFSEPGVGNLLLLCLLDGSFAGVQNFTNNEFDSGPEAVTGAEETIEFSIDGTAGEFWFITTDVFLFANNGGFVDSRNTVRVELINPGLVRSAFAAETFEIAPPIKTGVKIDIRPFSTRNRVRPGARGIIPVAVLGTGEFDALQIDATTVRFGPAMAHALFWLPRGFDLNHDGFSDLLLIFKTRRTGIQCGDTEAVLTGETFDRVPITGVDAVTTVGCKRIGSDE